MRIEDFFKFTKKEVNYPDEIFAVKRDKLTLSGETALSTVANEDKVNPMELHSGYSRIILNLIGEGVGINANIPAQEDLPYLIFNIKQALNKNLFSGPVIIEPQIRFGKCKGMTPSQAYKNGEIEELKGITQNLDPNDAKFGKMNKELIDTINKVLKNGPLSDSENVILYESEYKYFRNRGKNGKEKIYKIQITYNQGQKYPFTFIIENAFAPVKKNESGQTVVVLREKSDSIWKKMSISAKEMAGVCHSLERTLNLFENSSYEYCSAMAYVHQHESKKNLPKSLIIKLNGFFH